VSRSCEYGDEPFGFGATELVSWLVERNITRNANELSVAPRKWPYFTDILIILKH
jgi:hypothetical protein